MANSMIQAECEPTCPICLRLFNLPRQLPCAHTFCQSCLQSYITTDATKHEKQEYIECPICRKPAKHFKQKKPASEWASLFPADTVLQSLLRTKPKVDRMCDACNFEGVSVVASGFCAVCEESMCDDCLNVHRKLKTTRTHNILTVEEVLSNPKNVMKLSEGLTCFEHDREDLKFYCKGHSVACCGICFLESHKTCSNVKLLKEEFPSLLRDNQPSKIINELKKLEAHLKTFMDVNESNVNDLESQVNELTNQIRKMRKKIDTALDELEVTVQAEGNRIFKEFAIRKQKENHQCLSLIHALRNSHLLCEASHTYGTDLQQYLMAERIKAQLPCYYTQVRETYERAERMIIQVESTPLVESILSLCSSDIRKIVTTTGSFHFVYGLRKPTKECRIEKVNAFDVNIQGANNPWYSGVTIISRDRVILADNNNSQCILLNNSYELVTKYVLAGRPCDICVFDDEKVAVLLYFQNVIQIVSVRNNVISPFRTMTTKEQCYGIAAAGKGELIVVVACGDDKNCWILIKDGREVKSSDHYDSLSQSSNRIALDCSKTRVYITVYQSNSLHCFNMDGKKLFTYSPDNLKWPMGVAVDKDGIIYVVGNMSHNIHQVSSDGSSLHVITTGLPQQPNAICFDNDRDTFIVTSNSKSKHLHIYQLK